MARFGRVAVVRNKDARTRTVADLQLQAAQVEQTHAEVTRWIDVDRDRWNDATEKHHKAMSEMYPPDWATVVAELQHGDTAAVEPAIVFLEADPRCFRSGYEKEQLCRFLGRAKLTSRQRHRLLAVVVAASQDVHRPMRERRAFARLEASLATVTDRG